MAKAKKSRASKIRYVSPNQLSLVEFEMPFGQNLDGSNRWVTLASQIPWDSLVSVYNKTLNNQSYGADSINPRIAIGSVIIKHLCDLPDREVLQQIQENVYMQYFLGLPAFTKERLFDPSLFVDIRKRLGVEQINEITSKILKLPLKKKSKEEDDDFDSTTHKGILLMDATACPQDIAYPTDLNILNDAREKSEELIDKLHYLKWYDEKPRTYRKNARREYLRVAQKKNKTKAELRKALRKQLGYLNRNMGYIREVLIDKAVPFERLEYKYWLVIQTVYDQQRKMYKEKVHSIPHRIVSIHQPHVRPIVRGKSNAYVEFGAKVQVSLMNGIAFLDDLSWEAFNEGTRLKSSIEKYKERFGFYPESVLADKIYCNRENRAWLKEMGIQLKAKPLGRPSSAVQNHVRPGERNPIEGKFGQAKNAYGLNRIKARLDITSESWIASIFMVLNLIKIIGRASLCQLYSILFFLIYKINSYFNPSKLIPVAAI